MEKCLSVLIIIMSMGMAQDITNKLGGTSESDTYDITDSSDKVLLRVEGNGEIGIGTNSPDANLDVHGTVKVFGNWDTITYHTENIYLAATDGIVVAYLQGGGSSSTTIHGKTDSNATPTTIVAAFLVNTSGATGTIMMPVKKGDYWQITDTVTGANTASYSVNWLPLGQ